ncbi:MAG: InlB B-repeat-containing protein [Clostridia bacterium]|nr:InlB B-repeat-containing protein [Clostridia bacterium]
MNKMKWILSVMLAVLMLLPVFPGIIYAEAAHENTYSNTGNQRQDIIGVAKTQLGYAEGNNNDTKYGDWYGLPNNPWCAMFVSWCARQANIPTSTLPNSALANPSNFNLKYYSGASYTPQPGDLFFTTSFSHVGLVYYLDGNYFYSLEGNYNDCVCSIRRKISDYYFSTPNYKESHVHSYSRNYESAHPHKFFESCSCGDWYYTGETNDSYTYANESAHPHKEYKTCWCGQKSYTGNVGTDRSCSSCWDIEFTSTKSSINIYVTESDTLTLGLSGGIFPSGAKYDWEYDDAIISVETTDNKNFTIKGLKQGSSNLKFIAYVSEISSDGIRIITSLTIPVKVNPYPYKLSFNANGGTGAPPSQTSTTIPAKEPTRAGYTFRGWAKSSSATSPEYRPNDNISFLSNTTLYAVWKKSFYGDLNHDGIVNTADKTILSEITVGLKTADNLVTLKGDLNGDGKLTQTDVLILAKYCDKLTDEFPVEDMFGLVSITMQKTDYKTGESIKVDTFNVTYTNYVQHKVKTGFTYTPVKASGTGQQIVTATLGEWSAIMAIQVSDNSSYTLTYNANGGSGAPGKQTGKTSYTISSTVPRRTGYIFLGWSKNSGAITASYEAGNIITLTENTTLYAVWKENAGLGIGHGTPGNILKGDVNGDGKVNTIDVNRVYAHVRGTNPLTGNALMAANVVGTDSTVNTIDLNRIYAHVKGTNLLW